jgi:hypothetical protein
MDSLKKEISASTLAVRDGGKEMKQEEIKHPEQGIGYQKNSKPLLNQLFPGRRSFICFAENQAILDDEENIYGQTTPEHAGMEYQLQIDQHEQEEVEDGPCPGH